MAKLLADVKVKMGFAIPVENQNPAKTASKSYYALKLEDSTGDIEAWHLFTKKELENRPVIEIETFTQDWKCGRKYACIIRGKKSYAVRIAWGEGNCEKECCVLFTEGLLEAGLKRAAANPEDIPQQSAWADMMD